MDIRKVKKLIELLEESGIGEIEIHEGEESVRVSRVGSATTVTTQAAPASGAASSVAPTPAPEKREELEADGHVVKAPMVGIFYQSSAPEKPPFVELGRSVRKGDVLCIIEAMKLMNQIEADVSGVVARILVENGDPVEYGQPLFLIRES
ncbi:MAG TPA: acetyl-CoA carboxylase biotin carboxyl carrier protein [Gammaproteobacteria bacterium]|jgi:acetyl-CoA carboxylase biotin carboxyl carrier protein